MNWIWREKIYALNSLSRVSKLVRNLGIHQTLILFICLFVSHVLLVFLLTVFLLNNNFSLNQLTLNDCLIVAPFSFLNLWLYRNNHKLTAPPDLLVLNLNTHFACRGSLSPTEKVGGAMDTSLTWTGGRIMKLLCRIHVLAISFFLPLEQPGAAMIHPATVIC